MKMNNESAGHEAIIMGKRVREARKCKKMTLKVMAEKAGVTPPHISMVERGLIRPSLAVVSRLADALDISVAALFADDAGQVFVTRHGERTSLMFNDSSIVQMLSPAGSMMVHLVSGSDGETGDMSVIHTYDELLLVLSGDIDYLVGDRVYSLRQNDAIFIPAGIRHNLVGDRWRSALMLFVSPAGTEDQ